MPSEKQLAANRRNAKNSTGPRSAEGKAASRMNALKSGIHAESHVIRGEDPDDLTDLTERFYQRFQPTGPEQSTLVDLMVSSEWQLRRLRKVEAEFWETQILSIESSNYRDKRNPLGQVHSQYFEPLNRLQRRLDAADRSFHRALDKLTRLQTAARAEIGFVPSTVPDPPSAPPPPIAASPISPNVGVFPQSVPSKKSSAVEKSPKTDQNPPIPDIQTVWS